MTLLRSGAIKENSDVYLPDKE